MMKKLSFYFQPIFYILAGTNHFIQPDFYLELIPNYLPYHDFINTISGAAEIVLGIGLILPKTRTLSAYGIICMLIAFVPSHIYFIQIDGCVPDGLCPPVWVGWVRLIVIHPILILWAWRYRE
ncbi:MAG: hypothetical protein JXR03_18740 [Cyclobacteriaceae bacterium]